MCRYNLRRPAGRRVCENAVSAAETLLVSEKFRVERRPYTVRGRAHHKDVVVHPGAAVILPVLDDARILLIRNYRVAAGQALLELPAGTLDPPEPPIDCAARELAEETGYRAGKLTALLSFYASPGVLTELMHVFVATQLTPGPAALEETEQIELAPHTLGDALAAIGAGGIVDAKTIAALLYYARIAPSAEKGAWGC
jgi:ADP-ribose pyrophosphatase